MITGMQERIAAAMPLSKISRYRNEIMGISILWVMLFHSGVHFPAALWPAKFLKSIGYGAVDLFFFLSGFGVFHSWASKKPSIAAFYEARFLRIVPAYWLIVILYFLIDALINNIYSLPNFFYVMAGLNFFVQEDNFFWFIPSILCCYLLSPLIFNVIGSDSNHKKITRNLIFITAIALAPSVIITATNLNYLLIFTIRLPNFIFGVFAGYLSRSNSRLSWFEDPRFNGMMLFIGIAVLSIIVTAVPIATRWRFGLWWYPFILIAYPLSLMLALSFQWLSDCADSISIKSFAAILKMMKKAFSFCGRYSLEIYLIHVVLFKIVPDVTKSRLPFVIGHEFNPGRIFEYGIYALAAIGLSPLLNKSAAYCKFFILTIRQNIMLCLNRSQ